MIKNLRILTLALILVAFATTLSAQDLSSQRGESQELGELLGSRLDHGGLVINPTPQQIYMLRCPALDVSAGFALKGKASDFAEELSFLNINRRGVKLSLSINPKASEVALEEDCNKPGFYSLRINGDGVSIEAIDELGAFYAIQTLRQIVESPVANDNTLPVMIINDWPDLQYRGVVEGFYGTPWSHATRLSLIDTYGRYKMNYYVYGPKDDPYHSSPHWREPYPEAEARQIHELVEACNRNRVHFVWAIHPGQDIRWCEEDIQNLIRKFEAMYDLGVRAFAIHFDDISGEGTNPYRQTELMNILNEDFVAVKGDVEPLIVCPTDYTRLWANPTERGSLVIYGNELHPSIDVFWTGDAVCSDMTNFTMEWISSRIQRPALFWWNFPVTDYARHIVMQGPVYGLSTTMDSTLARGILSNPMEHGEASKLALYSVADYSWNVAAYNPIDSWERAIEAIAPEVTEAYRLFAIHSCDTETGYRRLESWETETFTMEEYTPELAAALVEECERIEAVPMQMEAMCNRALLRELRPWLTEFGKLGRRCRLAIEALEEYNRGGVDGQFWDRYVENLMSITDVEFYDAHRVGTQALQPFYERLMDDMAAAYYESLTGVKSSTLSAVGTYNSLAAPQAKYMFDNDPETYYHSGNGQRTDDFVAADMGVVREVREVRIIQGRNSVDDVDYFDHCVVEYSSDGESWTALLEPMQGVYEIEWAGEPFEARYVRLRKLESEKRNWLAIRAFEINPVEPCNYHLDANPFTMLELDSPVRVDIPESSTSIVALLGEVGSDSYYQLLDVNGEVVGGSAIEHSRIDVELSADAPRAAAIMIFNVDQLFEVIFK